MKSTPKEQVEVYDFTCGLPGKTVLKLGKKKSLSAFTTLDTWLSAGLLK